MPNVGCIDKECHSHLILLIVCAKRDVYLRKSKRESSTGQFAYKHRQISLVETHFIGGEVAPKSKTYQNTIAEDAFDSIPLIRASGCENVSLIVVTPTHTHSC